MVTGKGEAILISTPIWKGCQGNNQRPFDIGGDHKYRKSTWRRNKKVIKGLEMRMELVARAVLNISGRIRKGWGGGGSMAPGLCRTSAPQLSPPPQPPLVMTNSLTAFDISISYTNYSTKFIVVSLLYTVQDDLIWFYVVLLWWWKNILCWE